MYLLKSCQIQENRIQKKKDKRKKRKKKKHQFVSFLSMKERTKNITDHVKSSSRCTQISSDTYKRRFQKKQKKNVETTTQLNKVSLDLPTPTFGFSILLHLLISSSLFNYFFFFFHSVKPTEQKQSPTT